MDLKTLQETPRALMQVDLRPVQGTRFQPTGFPDLGAATYDHHDGTKMLLVESPQSMANRLELACWDEGEDDLVAPLRGLPYVRSDLPDGSRTNSILEAHRLNSPYIVNAEGFETIKEEIGFEDNQPFDRRKLAAALFKYDPNSLVHGAFLEKIGGVVRLPRALSGFIEARNVTVAPSGGVKIDRVQPASTSEKTPYGTAAAGYGNVPYHRNEYTGEVTAYFNLDVSLLKGYGLEDEALDLLLALALFKISRFLHDGLRLRTACDLEPVEGPVVTRPDGWSVPELGEIEDLMPELVDGAGSLFAEPTITNVRYKKK